MRLPPEVTTSALADPLQWVVLIGVGLAWAVLTGLAISVCLLVSVYWWPLGEAASAEGDRSCGDREPGGVAL